MPQVRTSRIGAARVGRNLSQAVIVLMLVGCAGPDHRGRLAQESEALWRENQRLKRDVAGRNLTIAELKRQIKTLQSFEPDRPVDMFRPVSLEIVSLTGGDNYDDRPGDDGVTVYLRSLDADGDVVKVPGRITIQLLDTTEAGLPRAVGVCVYDDPAELGRRWHSRFGTNHYTLKCPFSAGAKPRSPQVTVSVEFVDLLTGSVLTVVKEVTASVDGG